LSPFIDKLTEEKRLDPKKLLTTASGCDKMIRNENLNVFSLSRLKQAEIEVQKEV